MINNNSHAASNIFERLSRQEPDAFDDFIEQFGNFVAFAIRKFSGARGEEFDDAMQDSLLALWQAAPHFDPSRGAETTFIGTIVRRLMIDRWRKAAARGPRISIEAEHPEPEQDSVRHDPNHQILKALSRLGTEERTLVELAVIRGQTHAQIAQATGVARKSVKRIIHRALVRMRNDLSDRRAAA